MLEKESDLTANLDNLHTTQLGIKRIKKNLSLADDIDVVAYSKEEIETASAITRQGKNWYVHTADAVITINANSFTIITAHTAKSSRLKADAHTGK